MITIKKETLQFLRDLKENNNREWFNNNKERYISANENFIQFVQELIDEVSKFDSSVVGVDAHNSVFRIYRDVRFSKDKSPYKAEMGAMLMGKGTGCGIAGYYLHLEPGNSLLAGGVHMSEPKDLKAIREEISSRSNEFLKIINNDNFKNNFTLKGEKLSNVPKGFNKEDPMAEYLKYKELEMHHPVDENTILSDDFVSYCANIFKAMVPFNSFVNEPVMENIGSR